MRILIFVDVHGNLPALETLLKHERADQYISLGDIVNYGPWQNECVDLVTSIGAICLTGNHEQYYIQGKYPGDKLANRFFDYCYPQFTRHEIIKTWHKTHYIPDWILRHTYEDMIVYPDTEVKFSYNYIIGHSHHQSIHRYYTRTMYCIGSVGQNRQHINRIDYCILNGEPELKHLLYDESLIINEMKARKYPDEFIEYYSKKQRC